MGEINCLSGLSIKRGPTIHTYVGTPVDMYVIHLYLRIIYTSLCAVLTFVFVGVGIIVRIHMYLYMYVCICACMYVWLWLWNLI